VTRLQLHKVQKTWSVDHQMNSQNTHTWIRRQENGQVSNVKTYTDVHGDRFGV